MNARQVSLSREAQCCGGGPEAPGNPADEAEAAGSVPDQERPAMDHL